MMFLLFSPVCKHFHRLHENPLLTLDPPAAHLSSANCVYTPVSVANRHKKPLLPCSFVHIQTIRTSSRTAALLRNSYNFPNRSIPILFLLHESRLTRVVREAANSAGATTDRGDFWTRVSNGDWRGSRGRLRACERRE